MIWIKKGRGVYHILGACETLVCGVRIDFDGHHQIDSSYDPPGDERCKNCMRSIDHIHHLAHVHKESDERTELKSRSRIIDAVQYRYGKHPMIFTRKLIICKDFGEIEMSFKNVWIQQSGEVDDVPLRGAIAVYSIHKKGHIDTEKPTIIRIKYGRYYKFE